MNSSTGMVCGAETVLMVPYCRHLRRTCPSPSRVAERRERMLQPVLPYPAPIAKYRQRLRLAHETVNEFRGRDPGWVRCGVCCASIRVVGGPSRPTHKVELLARKCVDGTGRVTGVSLDC